MKGILCFLNEREIVCVSTWKTQISGEHSVRTAAEIKGRQGQSYSGLD